MSNNPPTTPDKTQVIGASLNNIEELLNQLYETAVDEAENNKGYSYVGVEETAQAIQSLISDITTEASTDNFLAKLATYSVTNQQTILGGIIYKYYMQETNATDVKISLENFSVKGKILGDLTITAQLKAQPLSKRERNVYE